MSTRGEMQNRPPPDREQQPAPAAAKPVSRLRRFGCALILVAWFAFLLTPCGLFYLAANGEIRLSQPDAPAPHAQPRLLITLINDPDNRGLQLLRSFPAGDRSENAVCIETRVNYLLWESRGGDQDVSYCDCYARAQPGGAWTLTATHSTHCE